VRMHNERCLRGEKVPKRLLIRSAFSTVLEARKQANSKITKRSQPDFSALPDSFCFFLCSGCYS
jgi:hypothetical protein